MSTPKQAQSESPTITEDEALRVVRALTDLALTLGTDFPTMVRRANGLTQAEVGRRIGASQSDVSRWETHGGCPDSVEVALRFHRLLKSLHDVLLCRLTKAPA